MAFETVYLDRGIHMASLAEIPVCAEHAVVHPARMAIHAFLETVSSPYPLMNRDGPLVLEEVAMVELHESGIVDAMPALADVQMRHRHIREGRT